MPLIRSAYAGWADLSEQAGTPMITWSGALMIGTPDAPVVAGTLASVRRWELEHEVLDQQAMAERFGQFALRDGDVAVLERDAGFVNPERAVKAQLALASGHGAELRFGVPVDGWELTAAGAAVSVAGDRIEAARLVFASGPWTSKVLGGVLPLDVVRTVTYHFEALSDPAAYRPDRFPAFVYELGPRDALYGVADAGLGAKVGFHYRTTPADPDAIDRDVGADEIETIRAILADRLPGLPGRCRSAAVCMYTMTPDENFVIGHVPGTDGRVSVAAGFSGHGFKFTPVVGEILADLAIDGSTAHPIGMFDPTRFDPPHSRRR